MSTIDDLAFSKPDDLAGAHVADLPLGIGSTRELMDALVQRLNLPGYFGRNWNALDEVLSDLSWIPEKRVFLVHQELPKIPIPDLRTYLMVLTDSIQSWQRGAAHQLVVVFPASSRASIAAHLAASSSSQ